MTLTQTVKIPDDYRIFLELPRSVPTGIMAKINIDIPVISTKAKEQHIKAFWEKFDAGAAASSEEVLHDDDFPRTSSSRKLELVFGEK